MSHAPHSGDADRARLRFWRSLDELDGAAIAAVPADNLAPMLERRDFLKVMAASLALSTAGCGRAPLEKIVPYRDGPPQDGYGKPVFYASAIVRDGYGCGVLVETNMGRPTKVEGNPSHPASLGATDLFAQAAVLDLWDPDRATAIMWGNAIDTWSRFVTDLQAQLRRSPDGDGLFILTETVTSPTLHDQLAAILARHPRARWHQYQPLARGHVTKVRASRGASRSSPVIATATRAWWWRSTPTSSARCRAACATPATLPTPGAATARRR